MFPLRDTIPSRYPPLMTWALIALNGLVFAFELMLPPDVREAFFYHFGIVPARLSHPSWAEWIGLPADNYWPFLTGMFLHGGWMHIIGNMWTLWIFGDNVEDRMGPFRFLVFYLLCGIAAGIVHVLTNPDSTVPTVGASGAIAGVLGAYFILFPRAHIITILPIFFIPLFFTLPAMTYVLIWFFMQFLSGIASLAGPANVGGIAWWAHIGGFVTGIVLVRPFLRPRSERLRHEDETDYRTVWDYRF
jgi:membrane associated rhomboid family serine protease